jgi:2-amino-4-hydroxy-6-hydroxymethyldihydropteridine diphosphokinase
MHLVYLGLGANLGDREKNLGQAEKRLGAGVNIVKRSSIYDTAPAGNERQPRFLNMACAGETELEPHALLAFIKGIETEMGRQPGPVNSPRPIDIDILFYDNLVINAGELVIPHPRLVERVFVLMPLAEIAPDLQHPVNGRTIREMLGGLKRAAQDIIKVERSRQ